MTLQTISIESLHLITGGQAAAPKAAPQPRELSDEELDDRFREHEANRAWEQRHPFSALICQGDPRCIESARR